MSGDRAGLGLHPLVLAIDECHELFQHKKHGRQAEELAVRLIKRGRKYGIILLLATQSPTKDSIPKEITRNVSCGVAFAVADHIANDGLLGAGRYRAGIRATELRMKTDRGTCVAVGITDEPWELVRTFYVTFEDGTDLVTPVIARAMAILAEHGRPVALTTAQENKQPAPADHLADIADVCAGEKRVRTQVVLARLIARNAGEYDGWTLRDLTAALAADGIVPVKSDGVMVVRADDLAAALADRKDREPGRDPAGSQGDLPDSPRPRTPSADQRKHRPGRQHHSQRNTLENPGKHGQETTQPDSLPGGANDS
ncbi:hypothetical protein GCM10022222_32340 [Amycolatopsis ultiminotia]|uniref:Uncharacterized protein n=1 Tax=Amycolatopsis ultiminotia TaxID=543629 RepID=A0ABP6W6H4_9PSEU